MLSLVEDEFAFLSILPLSAGPDAAVVSTSVAESNPTLSTTVVPESLYKTMLLLAVMALDVAE